jgi:hypothetical protein
MKYLILKYSHLLLTDMVVKNYLLSFWTMSPRSTNCIFLRAFLGFWYHNHSLFFVVQISILFTSPLEFLLFLLQSGL